MSFRVTSYHYTDEESFININPWFHVALESRISRVYESERLRQKIRSEINDQFPALWRNHMASDTEYRGLFNRLSAATDADIVRVHRATDDKVNQLMENGSLESVKSSIFNTAMSRYSRLDTELRDQFTTNERVRNERLVKAENEIKSLKSGQIWTALGGMAVGIGLGVLGMRK
jgi:hypothetical protein